MNRRQALQMGGGAAVAVAAASALPGRAEAVHATAVGQIAVERLWRYYYKYTKTYYKDSRGRRRAKYVKTKVLRTKYLYEGTATKILNYGGVCHWIGTAQPLNKGNCVLFGHRTSRGGPLRYTHKIKVGDQIVLSVTGKGTKTYRVMEKPRVISNKDFSQAINWGNPGKANVTLVACTKKNGLPTSTAYRLLIRATEI